MIVVIFNWIIELNEFGADFGVYIIKLHFNGYSCNKELSPEFNCSIARATVILMYNYITQKPFIIKFRGTHT
jgi:hypothetical protein